MKSRGKNIFKKYIYMLGEWVVDAIIKIYLRKDKNMEWTSPLITMKRSFFRTLKFILLCCDIKTKGYL